MFEQDERAAGVGVDAVLPKEMARHAEAVGREKAEQSAPTLLILAAMAGAYIGFGATFAATVSVGLDTAVSPGFARLVGGLAFSLAYVLAIVGGAELFTTNNLMVMAWADGRLKTGRLLRAWGLVFVGNFAGAVAMAVLLVLASQHADMSGRVGDALVATAVRLQNHTMTEAFFLGVLGNTLLCLGVWLTYSARTTTDRVVALTPPVAAFYALGLEHAIAVMFYVPCAALVARVADTEAAAAYGAGTLGGEAGDFLAVLVPVTLGNVVGGGVLVALVYWFVYLRPNRHGA